MTQPLTVVLDSGGCTIKAGIAGNPSSLRVVPNCTAKIKGERQAYIADTVQSCPDLLSVVARRPVDRGYTVTWDLQRDIWLRVYKAVLGVPPATARLVLTEPLFNLPALREAALQVLFDEIGVESVCLAPAPACCLRWHAHRNAHIPANAAGCGLVVDAGFSFTHAVPVFDWHVVEAGVRRIDLGGKALTNHMKTLVSYRSINMMEEGYLMEYIKEQLCFVSPDPVADLAACKGPASKHRRLYILPDGVTSKTGHVFDPEAGEALPPQKDAVLVVNNERFMVPEAIFHPSGIGLNQAGLAEAIVDAVNGGTVSCPGFKERLESELRPLVPDIYDVCVFLAEDPIRCAWLGASLAATQGCLDFTTRDEYRQRAAAHRQQAAARKTPTPSMDLATMWDDEDTDEELQ